MGAVIAGLIATRETQPQHRVASAIHKSTTAAGGPSTETATTVSAAEKTRDSHPEIETPTAASGADQPDPAEQTTADERGAGSINPLAKAAVVPGGEDSHDDPETIRPQSRPKPAATLLRAQPADASRKRAVPDAAALNAVREKVRAVLKSEFADAKTPQSHFELGKRLLRQASESKDEAPTQYALLVAARQEAIKSGNPDLVLDTIHALADDYHESAISLSASALTETAKQKIAPGDRLSLAASAIQQFEIAVAADDYDSAEKLAAVAKAASAKVTDRPVKQAVANCLARLKLTHAAFDRVAGDFKTLRDDPENAAANLAVGKYLCLARRDWRVGLPPLARGGNTALTRLAQQESETAVKPSDQVKLANDWWEFSATLPAADKDAVREHATDWYARVLPSLTGLPRQQALHRLLEGRSELYLADLPHLEVKSGEPERVHVELHINSTPYHRGLCLHAIDNGTAMVSYAIDKRFRWLTGGVAINDQNDAGQPTPLTYRILGDGRMLWESPALQERGKIIYFDVSVAGVNRLELQVDCPGWNGRGHSAFIDPRLSR